MTSGSARPRIRLLAIIEGSTVNGPAKNLLEFCRISRGLEEGPIIETSLLLFQRPAANSGAQSAANELMEQAFQDGVPVHCITERYAFDLRVIGALKKTVDRLAPDILQTHMFKSHFLVRASGAHKNRAWVAFHHGYTNSTLRYDFLSQLDRWSLRAPSQVVTVSQSFSRQLSARGVPSCRIMVLHNAIDPEWLSQQKEDRESARQESVVPQLPRKKLVLAVGRLSKEKGFLHLIAAFRYLRDARPGLALRLVIVGEGLERKNIEDAIRDSGLEQQVLLAGHVKDVRPYYRAADVMAISSVSEGSPNALLEAMAAGIPVVSTEVGGIPEIVSHRETAFLVPPRDPVALAKAIDLMLSDDGLAKQMAGRAREVIRNRYSPMSRVQSLVRLYERIGLPEGTELPSEPWMGGIADSNSVFVRKGRSLTAIQPNETHKF